MDFLIGGMAAVCAGVFTNPLEVLKIRLQLQGELQSRAHQVVHYKNTFHAAYVIAKNEGILALQKGLVPATWTQLVLNGVRLGIFEAAYNHGLITNEKGEIVFLKSVVFGSLSGVAGALVSSPFFLVKTQIQSSGHSSIAVGTQHKHRGTWPALSMIFKKHGIFGLFRGCHVTMARAAVGSTFQLTTFAECKQWMAARGILINYPILTSFVASLISGVAIVTAMTPLDLLSTRIYNQAVDKHGNGILYDGLYDGIKKIYKTEGFLGFYKGFMPNYVRLGPHTVLCFVFWDKFKQIHTDFTEKYRKKKYRACDATT